MIEPGSAVPALKRSEVGSIFRDRMLRVARKRLTGIGFVDADLVIRSNL
jgi:hypothetical protein